MASKGIVDDLDGRVAVVTGGARGVGYAVAETLRACGVRVALVDLLPEVAESARRLGGGTIGLVADVTDPEQVDGLVRDTSSALGGPDVLVHCAGIALVRPALEMPLAEWQRVLDVNLTATFLVCRAFARSCVAAGRPGTIVTIASMSGRIVNVPQPQSAYNVSKAGVEALTRSLAVEWLPLGIRVNAVSPGYLLTDMTRDAVRDRPEEAALWRSRIPAGDLGDPADIGPAVAYLASSASRYVVGQCVVVDGGYTIV